MLFNNYSLFSPAILNNEKPFFIDLFTEGKLFYPATIDDVFRWIRESQTSLEKKFLIYYIIKNDLSTLVGQVPEITQDSVDLLIHEFLKKFNLVRKPLLYSNLLMNLN